MSKNILVTGCSRGVGLEICRVLLREGYNVYGIARSYTDEFKVLEQEYIGHLFFKSIDLADSGSVRKSVFKEFVTNDILLDGYVNNAAVAYDDIVTNLNIDRLKAMYEVNVFTPMVITKYAIRNMLLHKTRGSIVHISSISVHTGYKGLAMYASSKGAIEAFSKDTAREWGQLGIRSNVVVPGFMETAMSASLTEEQRAKIYARTSLKAATNVGSVAETVAFLLSDKACSITGQNVYVDNGTI
ncbi:MAG: SDR family oxidoreductase [Bacteroidales bacterium]|nr:SDR family oxidoreductase [Bacteroidales bacterium]